MSDDVRSLLDDTSKALLRALQDDARLSYAALGRQVGLTAPAVADRLRRLEEAGIITGYRALVDQGHLGWKIAAFVRIRVATTELQAFEGLIRDMSEVAECHTVTGEESYILKVRARSIAHLEQTLGKLSTLGATTSSMILGTPVPPRSVDPP